MPNHVLNKIKILLPGLKDVSAGFPRFEFHVSAPARKRYGCDDELFSMSGNVVLANITAVREMALKMRRAGTEVSDGELQAMGLIDELMHYVIAQYKAQKNPRAMALASEELSAVLGAPIYYQILHAFTGEFPPLLVHRHQITAGEYINGRTAGVPNREISLEELLLLWVANQNPAQSKFHELFGDKTLAERTKYPEAMALLEKHFNGQPRFGPDEQSLVDLLLSPARAHPHSLYDQLLYIKIHWLAILPGDILDKLFRRLMLVLDIIREEQRMRGGGPGPAQVFDFSALGKRPGPSHEPEAFSPDLDWMPNVAMMAKNTPVWLDQLSKKYQKEIGRLDQIPDEELEILASRGFNALWLIGVWERSSASQKIKQRCGNPEALPSAYSLYDYEIAGNLGGEHAYWELKHRAAARGIRIAVDMVPNHTGVYSRWMVEHPGWFIQSGLPPFPAYSFHGPDLSDHPEICLQIEDGYWNRNDAAVVFKRTDKKTGEVRYIYHGNDGTHMPWNDTAQLNFLLPEVRGAVLGQILKVARYSSIIRFDAAMTLAKRHYQRLWFPEPGSGGDIPSRAEQGLSRDDFDRAFPVEFWREVVDAVARECPQTLLLAEAFWLMEGYFVRSLGMHRVYNSAFMNMLKKEENGNYRQVLKNVLEFNPEILKRFVNFMNNPDEEPAASQFGKGDKYFGVCAMMATLPGLPMFGHGQIEGFAEKYGMEYARAYWNEQPDNHLIERHEREIFPLLRMRHLFSEVDRFVMYDAVSVNNAVQQDVFAYSNGRAGQNALFVYNNRYQRVEVRVLDSVRQRNNEKDPAPYSVKLAGALGLEESGFYAFRENVSGNEFLQPAPELWRKGLQVQLDGYQYKLYSGFRKVGGGDWERLCNELNGRGVPSLERSLLEMKLHGVLMTLSALTAPLEEGWSLVNRASVKETVHMRIQDYVSGLKRFREEAVRVFPQNGEKELNEDEAGSELFGAMERCVMLKDGLGTGRWVAGLGRAIPKESIDFELASPTGLKFLYAQKLMSRAEMIFDDKMVRTVISEKIGNALIKGGTDPTLVRDMGILWNLEISTVSPGPALVDEIVLKRLLAREDIQAFLQCNWHNGTLWFRKESFLTLLYWLAVRDLSFVGTLGQKRKMVKGLHNAAKYSRAAEDAGYRFHRMLELL
jgi:glycosidase